MRSPPFPDRPASLPGSRAPLSALVVGLTAEALGSWLGSQISASRAQMAPVLLPRAVQPLVDDLRYHGRVDRQTAHCRVEKVGLFFCQGADDVLDRDIILIATF